MPIVPPQALALPPTAAHLAADDLGDYVQISHSPPPAFDQDALFVASDEIPAANVLSALTLQRSRSWAVCWPRQAAEPLGGLQGAVATALVAPAGNRCGAWEEILRRCRLASVPVDEVLGGAAAAGNSQPILERLLAEPQAEVVALLLPHLTCQRYGALHRLEIATGPYLGAARYRHGRWRPHGNGLLSPTRGGWVTGTWKNGSPSGAMCRYLEGETFCGGLDSHLGRQGKGQVYFAGGERLRGVWCNHRLDGPAVITWPEAEGRSYFGTVHQCTPVPHGHGTMTWQNTGNQLSGLFCSGRIDHGCFQFAQVRGQPRCVYRGPMLNLKPHGQGILDCNGASEPCLFQEGTLFARSGVGEMFANASRERRGRQLAPELKIRYLLPHEGPRPPSPHPPTRAG